MIDRSLQKSLLERLAQRYPDHCYDLFEKDDPNEHKKIANILYLEEHGLLKSGLTQTLSGSFISQGTKITARGLDFLADDGGLTAILGTVTVKLHADTVKELLEKKVRNSDLPQHEKGLLLKKIAELGSEALKTATNKLVEQGIDNLPNVSQWLQALLT